MAVDERALSDALRELAEADTIAFGPVGFAGAVLPATQAYWTVAELAGARSAPAARESGADLTGRLLRLVAEASPAGKVYAAALLDRLDPTAARDAWRTLTADRAEVTTFSGCVMNRTTVAEYAADRQTLDRP